MGNLDFQLRLLWKMEKYETKLDMNVEVTRARTPKTLQDMDDMML